MKGKWKTKGKFEFVFFPVGDSQKSKCVFWEVYAWLGVSVKVGTFFFTKSVNIGFGELSISRICAESKDLQSGHGFRACSFKTKRNKLDFHSLKSKQRKQIGTNDDIGQILVSGAPDDTKKMRKLGADTFPKSPDWKTKKRQQALKTTPDFPRVSRELWLS